MCRVPYASGRWVDLGWTRRGWPRSRSARTPPSSATRPRSQELWASGRRVMPNGVPMSWLRTSYDHPPLFIESAAGSRLRDVDGHEYADFNIADMSMFTGYGPAPVVEAVSRQVAPRRAVPAPDRGLGLGRRRAGASLRPSAVAVHARGDEREHRGHPDRTVRDRPREGAVLRRQVPRPLRRRPGRARGRPPGAGGGRPAARRHHPDARRTVQRPRRPGARALARATWPW